ncbi:MAG TPA: hypothetical protein VHY19_02400 [Steroidobacteraceae bacterium]|jgi:ElaB/YqjD/DUF883 family membrane-anchored ribosome-binding protein|nr:hypothetical protein [Steroidobacteraceae bacterium]
MSEFSNGTASNVGRAAGAALSGVGEMKEQLGEAASRARSKVDGVRKPIADKLHDTAGKVREHADRISDAAGTAADRLEASANYVKSRDARRMAQDLVGVIKKHPAQALLIAGVVGFLVARAFRSKD